MYKILWQSPDGFFGEENCLNIDEAIEIKRYYERQNCEANIIEEKD